MNTKNALAILMIATSTLVAGCADDTPAGESDSAEADVTKQLSDAALQGKLRGILKDVTFMSESDYPYVVFEGEATDATRLSAKLVREKLGSAVLANSGDHRDIKPSSCRSQSLDVSEAIADGEAADPNDDMSGRHDRQLMIALKTMRAQLKGVTGYTFGTNENGDQDEFGTVLYIYVGISKTTGKLIAIMTEAVYT